MEHSHKEHLSSFQERKPLEHECIEISYQKDINPSCKKIIKRFSDWALWRIRHSRQESTLSSHYIINEEAEEKIEGAASVNHAIEEALNKHSPWRCKTDLCCRDIWSCGCSLARRRPPHQMGQLRGRGPCPPVSAPLPERPAQKTTSAARRTLKT
jgi:hypothetical protein